MLRISARLGPLMLCLGLASSAWALDDVRLAQNLSPISGVTIVAAQQGMFENNGLRVQVSNFSSGRQALETVLGGGADIATTAEAPITAATMAGQKIAFLARMEYSNLKTLAGGGQISAPAQLKGKRLGYTAGTGSEVYTLMLLEHAGLAPADVTLINLRPQDMAPALARGSIDAMNTWEPHIANAARILGDKAALLDTAGVYAETFNIVSTQDYLAAHPAVVERFMRALVEAEAWIKANPQQAIAVIGKAVGVPDPELAAIWTDYVYEVTIDQRTFDVLAAHAKWRLDSGNAPTGATLPDFRSIVFAAPLRAVAPERVTVPGL